MKKWIMLFVVVGVALGVFTSLIMTGPEMKSQPNIRAYQARVPLPPAGVVPVSAPGTAHDVEPTAGLPSSAEAAALQNPLRATPENLTRGRTYYQYYCLACHGEAGDGNGPVGQSFLPPPADLRSAKLRSLKDGELLRAMFTGVGHQPEAATQARAPVPHEPSVLEYIVLPEHRWYLVLYIRSLEPGRETAGP
jgi:mono/diheme cytochrome c family protein